MHKSRDLTVEDGDLLTDNKFVVSTDTSSTLVESRSSITHKHNVNC